MNPGTMNRRITIQSNTGMSGSGSSGCPLTTDEFGQAVDVWTPVYECWAAMNFTTGKQVFNSAEFVTRTAYNIEARWNPQFTFSPNQRVVYVEKSSGVTHTYTIESISNPNQANKTVALLVYELDASE